MANSVTSINYVDQFSTILDKKYASELKTYALMQSNPGVTWVNSNTIKIPKLTVGGFKNHTRGNAFNLGAVSNEFEVKTLSFDRDIEIVIDQMDIDETNLIMSIANIQNTLEETQSIPEQDSYRFSKIYADIVDPLKGNKTASVVTKSASDVLAWFDDNMAKMDDASVPAEGRILYVTPEYKKLINRAMSRQLTAKDKAVETAIDRLGDVEIITVPSARMRTEYTFTDGCVPATKAGKIGLILIHPSAVVCREKYSYIKVFTPGSDSRTADSYILQERRYGDLFILDNKYDGIEVGLDTAPQP